MKVTLHSHHNPSLLLSNEVRSTPWPDNIWDTSHQNSFFGGYNIAAKEKTVAGISELAITWKEPLVHFFNHLP